MAEALALSLASISLGSTSQDNKVSKSIVLEPLADLDGCYTIVDTPERLAAMIHNITALLATQQYLNVDFEGIDLCKTGKICLGQFQVTGDNVVYIVDFEAIKDPFRICDGALKAVMESASTVKVFYDPRNDSDALTHQFNLRVQNALCLQTAEVAHRRTVQHLPANYVMGLGKALELHLVQSLPLVQRTAVQRIKESGHKLFAPEVGGSYEVFAERPLAVAVASYAAVDVLFFDRLRQKLFTPLTAHVQARVLKESNSRLLECLNAGYQAKGRAKAVAPRF